MKKFLSTFFLLFSLTCFAQGEANFWFFGQNAGIDFNDGTATPISGSLSTNEGCASFSDINGDLLFYTDGIRVWDKNSTIMPNGSSLLGDPSSTQSAIIVPHPGKSHLFYIFTVGANDYDRDGNLIKPTEGLNSYVVDMTQRNGLGDIVGSPENLSGTQGAQWTEKVTSVKGSECNTFWVISLIGNRFVSFKIDKDGLHPTPIYSTVYYNAEDPRGYLKVSPDAKKIASATYGTGRIFLYSFNDVTGIVSNDGISLIENPNLDGYTYGVEFSPNSSKLYCSTFNGGNLNKLFQFDIDNANITSSKFLVNTQFGYRGGLQLGPNGKIYATVPPDYYTGTPYLNTINQPDELGIDCDFEQDAIDLSPGLSMQGLPPFISSLLLPIEITDGITYKNLTNTTAKRCIGENYELTAQTIEGSPVYRWTFNGVTVSDSEKLDLPNLDKSSEGLYRLEVETVDDCGFKLIYKGEVNLAVYEPPTITKPTNIIECDNDTDGFLSVDLNNLRDAEVLNGQDSLVFEVVYFKDFNEALENKNPIADLYTNQSPFSKDQLYARIQNIQNPICFEIESFTIQIFETSYPPDTISTLSICDSNLFGTDTDGIELFDLTEKETEILNGQDPLKFSFAYYTDSTFTSQISNPKTFENSNSNSQEIYVEIKNKNYTDCKNTTSFQLEVFSLPEINNSYTFKQCDEDLALDGFADFNLNEANAYLTRGDNTLEVRYFLSFSDAQLNSNPLNSESFTNATQNTVYARIENVNGCFRIAQVDLLVSATQFPSNYKKTVIQCDDDDTIDGLNLFNLNTFSPDILSQLPTGQNLSITYYRNFNDAQLEINNIPTDTPYLNETAFNQTLFVRVESEDNGECFGLGPYLNLIVNERPEFELNESAIYCLNLPPITVEIYNPMGDYSYSWTNENGIEVSNQPSAIINKEGIYTVIATSSEGCESFPHSIIIEPSIDATIRQNDISIIDDSNNNSITINTANLGIGDYEFSLDDGYGDYQDEPYFENVEPGIHTLYIRDKKGCGVVDIDISVLGFPKFFTPNGDGHNDLWIILGVNEYFYTSSKINIFDRFGKLVAEINPTGGGWNGIFNGEQLAATDYWFTVELTDINGNIRTRKGHFSLIR